MTSARRLLLVRHGQTALNAEGRLRGLADPPLDAVGQRQAAALGEALRSSLPSIVLTSPLQRAVATGEAIAATTGAELRVDRRFNDRDYGQWTGAVKAKVVARFGSVDAAPGVEPGAVVLLRARPALDSVLDAVDGLPVVVTHDAVIRALIHEIAPDLPPTSQPNGCWNELVRERSGTWRVTAVDRVP
ncbi:histidine phosphatase family protein [Amnibacterium sp.]|uniref:histidine phosphatase family protein n=1 Tax=Amnibacterium sp. TaxID=1872496 RepID=UPI003F7B70EC